MAEGAKSIRAWATHREHNPRCSGILLHPTSLPGPHGIGSLGREALAFVDFLQASGLCIWQVLPLGPTGYGDSPYQSFSSFAGNPLLIDLEDLVQEGFLKPDHLKDTPLFPEQRVDYGMVFPFKRELLKTAYTFWKRKGTPATRKAFASFCHRASSWLEDFSLFMALKRTFEAKGQAGAWSGWPEELIQRKADALKHWRQTASEEIEQQKFQQFLFFRQWERVKGYAAERGIRIIGDLPIYVAYDSADVWAHQELFHLDAKGLPTVVAGVPPDYFSETGQLWGNPIYNWRRHKESGYGWWIERVRAKLHLVDILRIDHFRGFEAYWEVPAGEPTAENGRWVKGPAADFFYALEHALKPELGDLPLIAEDLGVITPPVEKLRDRFSFPGMKVLQFAFDGDADNEYLPHNYLSNCVVYTGTHDNDTTLGWFLSESAAVQDQVRRYLGRDGHDITWDLIRLAFSSTADMAVIPLQDALKLDNTARMNIPSRSVGNWQWRYSKAMITEEIIGRLRELTQLYGRSPQIKVASGQPE
ncbi:MAG: 4-alpha-glucanotransferase [Spirochaetaceae bacterium]|nr:MAG: 4-alpha-glucanotransferase [Spirochaetaceae bacterium]